MALVRYVEKAVISGQALRQQRVAAGLSQQLLAEHLSRATGFEYNQMAISRLETTFESTIDAEVATALQSILSENLNS